MLESSGTNILKKIRKTVYALPHTLLDDEVHVLVRTRHGNYIVLTSYQWISSKHKKEYQVIEFF